MIMKTVFGILFVLVTGILSAQDKSVLEEIDRTVTTIRQSTIPAQRHVSVTDNAEVGMKITNYLTVVADSSQLLYYSQDSDMEMTQNGAGKKVFSSSAFFFSNNKLIKVEEFILEGDQRMEANWYFRDDKLLFSTLSGERDLERAAQLLELAKVFVSSLGNGK